MSNIIIHGCVHIIRMKNHSAGWSIYCKEKNPQMFKILDQNPQKY